MLLRIVATIISIAITWHIVDYVFDRNLMTEIYSPDADSISIPIITVSTTLAQNDFEVPMNIAIPGSYSIYGISAAFTTGGFKITTIGGDY